VYFSNAAEPTKFKYGVDQYDALRGSPDYSDLQNTIDLLVLDSLWSRVGGSASSSSGTNGGSRYRCGEIGSWSRAQELLRQGHTHLDRDGDGEACESLK